MRAQRGCERVRPHQLKGWNMGRRASFIPVSLLTISIAMAGCESDSKHSPGDGGTADGSSTGGAHGGKDAGRATGGGGGGGATGTGGAKPADGGSEKDGGAAMHRDRSHLKNTGTAPLDY